MLKKYDETETQLEQRYEETILMDAIDEAGKPVRVIDPRRKRIYTESQVDAELTEAKNRVTELQAKKDKIIALKSQ